MSDPMWQGSGPQEPGAPYGSGPLPPPWYELTPDAATTGATLGAGGTATNVEPAGKGLFGSLLDRNFENLVTVKLLRMLYTLAILCVTGFNFVLFLFGWSLAAGSFWPFLGWVIVMGVPVLWLAELLMARVVVEYLIVQHKISTDLAFVREAVKDIRASKS